MVDRSRIDGDDKLSLIESMFDVDMQIFEFARSFSCSFEMDTSIDGLGRLCFIFARWCLWSFLFDSLFLVARRCMLIDIEKTSVCERITHAMLLTDMRTNTDEKYRPA